MRNHARGFLFLSLVFLAGAAAIGQDGQAEAAKVVVPNEGDTGKIKELSTQLDSIKSDNTKVEALVTAANLGGAAPKR